MDTHPGARKSKRTLSDTELVAVLLLCPLAFAAGVWMLLAQLH